MIKAVVKIIKILPEYFNPCFPVTYHSVHILAL